MAYAALKAPLFHVTPSTSLQALPQR